MVQLKANNITLNFLTALPNTKKRENKNMLRTLRYQKN